MIVSGICATVERTKEVAATSDLAKCVHTYYLRERKRLSYPITLFLSHSNFSIPLKPAFERHQKALGTSNPRIVRICLQIDDKPLMIPSLAGVVHLLSFGMVCFPIVYSQGCPAGFCSPTRFEQRPSARSDLHPLMGSIWGLCWRIVLPTIENLQQRLVPRYQKRV